MAIEASGVEPQDREAIDAYAAALRAFAEKLNLVHIAGGTPSYATVAAASVRPRLTTTGLNEMLTGKRLPTLEALLEYLRVVTTPSGLDKPAAAKFRADAAPHSGVARALAGRQADPAPGTGREQKGASRGPPGPRRRRP